jgi:hypothetical protein
MFLYAFDEWAPVVRLSGHYSLPLSIFLDQKQRVYTTDTPVVSFYAHTRVAQFL